MVNFGLNAAAILGLFLAVAGAGLFFLRSIRPELARDYDIFFAAVGLLCGIILLFNGWRLDPILQFGQFLLTGTAIFFAFESIRMRGVATEQARRNTPIVDRDRPVSRTRVYTEAELDQIDPYDNVYEGAKPNYNSPRLRAYDDPNPRPPRRSEPRRRPSPQSDVRDEPRRRTSRNRPENRDSAIGRDRYAEKDSRPRRRPSAPPNDSYDDWNAKDEWADNSRPSPRSRPRPRPTREDRYSDPTPPPAATSQRRPSPGDLGRSYEPEDSYDDGENFGSGYDDAEVGRNYEEDEQTIPGDYVVDYQPVDDAGSDYSEDSEDSGDYDDYDDYDDAEDRNSDSRYDDRGDRPETRQPINFDNKYE
ncbi:Ycf66 family protein [Waterburya agarophytonicola K14]|uniref:Ycf66 family protein n=1 Tax=Waterburya agarophytonicola KI4 TaxID=2874699 RepID=A0A964BNT2_9CYAN|nr:Ycf66 family protein [Waterburya agarophytonicola]MCC0176838.1 Ycf66 family protein [Waterburya agarophytonicola KI4]